MAASHGNIADKFLHSLHNQGFILNHKPFVYIFSALVVAFLILDPGQTLRNFRVLLFISPFWLTYILGSFSIKRWLSANRIEWMAKQEYILLEIKVPRDVRKTPLAMETVFTSMHLAPGESTWWKKYVEGRVRPWWSIEVVSIGGRVHFYLWTRKGLRRGIESSFYAQYPGIEIVEATDYSRLIDPSHEPYEMWGTDYKFTKDTDALPIKTYVDFMKPDSPMAKPEEQVDPFAQMIELLGSIGPKEQFWFQMVFRVHKGEKFHKGHDIQAEAKAQLEVFRKQTVRSVTKIDAQGNARQEDSFPNPSRGVQNNMELVERKMSKPLFDVGLRALYAAPKDAYQGATISHLIGLLKPFGSETLNGFGITRWFANYDDQPWQDRKGFHRAHTAHNLTDAYRRRMFFHEPHRLSYMIMNTEELATLFHIPSSGVTTPSLPRIQSSTSEAPSNLPT